MKKIRVAIIKLYGMSSAGTESFLREVARNLNKERFGVTFFYSDRVEHINGTCDFENLNEDVLKEMRECENISLIPFSAKVDLSHPYQNFVKTDFWEKFDENNFDIILTGKYSWPSYPFTKIKRIPIIDGVHYLGKIVDNSYNISRVINISKWSENKWIRNGGDRKRSVVIYHPIQIEEEEKGDNLREKLDLGERFVFGLHQRVSDGIFSKIPLEAYKKVESDKTAFVILGGSKLYSKQAEDLNLKNFIQLGATGDKKRICQFLRTLDVYSHGRFDGETFGRAICEGMFFSLPVISHKSHRDNGHVETVGNAGVICENGDVEKYSEEMQKLMTDKSYYKMRSENSKKRFEENYDVKDQIKKIEKLLENALKNPYPNKIRRFLFLVEPIQIIKKIGIFIYFKLKGKRKVS